MSELKAIQGVINGQQFDLYFKDEADKVIADLEESHKMEVEQLLMEIAEMQKQVHDYAQCLYVIQARAEKEARHDKYKRCLAMADWCEATSLWCYQAANTLPAGFHATLHGKPVILLHGTEGQARSDRRRPKTRGKAYPDIAERVHSNVRIIRIFNLEKKIIFFAKHIDNTLTIMYI